MRPRQVRRIGRNGFTRTITQDYLPFTRLVVPGKATRFARRPSGFVGDPNRFVAKQPALPTKQPAWIGKRPALPANRLGLPPIRFTPTPRRATPPAQAHGLSQPQTEQNMPTRPGRVLRGQRPGFGGQMQKALNGRDNGCAAHSGLDEMMTQTAGVPGNQPGANAPPIHFQKEPGQPVARAGWR